MGITLMRSAIVVSVDEGVGMVQNCDVCGVEVQKL